MPGLRTRLEPAAEDEPCVVAVAGEVDPATIIRLSLFIAANCSLRRSLELDLSDVTFTDCSLLRLLQTELRDRVCHNAIVRVVCPSEAVRRLLELTDHASFLAGLA